MKQANISSFFQAKADKGGDSGAKQKSIKSFFQPKPSAQPPSAAGDGAKPAPAPATKPADRPAARPDSAAPKRPAAAVSGASPKGKSPKAKSPAGKPAAAGAPGPELVGKRVKVYWPDDEAWYKGTVAAFDAAAKKHRVSYDDGEEEELDFGAEKFRVLEAGGGSKPSSSSAAAAKKPPAKRSRAVLLSDDDEEQAAANNVDEDAMDVDDKESGSEYEASDDDDDDDDDESLDESDDDDDDDDEEEDLEDDLEDDHGGKGGGGKTKGKGGASGGLKRKRLTKGGSAAATAGKGETPAAGIKSHALDPRTPFSASAGDEEAGEQGTASGAGAGAAAARRRATPGSAAPQRTPAPGARKRMHNALALAPGGATATAATAAAENLVYGVKINAAATSETLRFSSRMVARFPFLAPEKIMDASKRRPDHPDYDPRTLYIPPNWFKEQKVTEAQQQWWHIKASNFDSVLLFKMGKFYEMFEMDAYVGVDLLGLVFMSGEQPHAGFPEGAYQMHATTLARHGVRVVVVEQTETPDQLAERNEERRRQGLKKVAVVNREKVAVLSRGTLVEAEMVRDKADASYILALWETEAAAAAAAAAPAEGEAAAAASSSSGSGGGGGEVVRLGMCLADVASAQLLVGQFGDDEIRSHLRTYLTASQPVELVLPAKPLSATTMRVLKACLRDPQVSQMRGPAGAWSVDGLLQLLSKGDYFSRSAALRAAGGEGALPPEEEATEEGDRCGDLGGASGASPGGSAAAAADGVEPPALRRLKADARGNAAALSALCGMVSFLKDSLLDAAVLPLGRIELLPDLTGSAAAAAAARRSADADADAAGADAMEVDNAATEEQAAEEREAAAAAGGGGGVAGLLPGSAEPQKLLLNGAALENLELLENADGGLQGTLLAVLDHCTTPFGRRKLRSWLCAPLYRVADISARQDAVEDLMGSAAGEAAGAARKALAGVSDLERAIARLHATTVAGAAGRDNSHVVLYEDAARRKVKAVVSAINDLKGICAAAAALQRVQPQLKSQLLRRLVDPGSARWRAVNAALSAVSSATDWQEAVKTGRVVPAAGVDRAYDDAQAAVRAAERELDAYLREVRQQLGGGKEITYINLNKDSHVIEVPESFKARVPKGFDLVGSRKGYARYSTPRRLELLAELEAGQKAAEEALGSILQALVGQFVSKKDLWLWAVETVAHVDALMSLAAHAMRSDTHMCRPKLLPPVAAAGAAAAASASASPVLRAEQLCHPGGIAGRDGAFVPNDICVGGPDAPPFLLLTGPNMGGKSTLLRQACLAVVLAQVGAWVPAQSLELTPVDQIFVRMGAKDSIITGQSTFFIELSETASMLLKATPASLVILDELGRGTATMDGAAIAGAVLQHLAHATGCRGLFATHYHHLSDEHAADPQVAIMHMACAINEPAPRAAAAPAAAGGDANAQEEEVPVPEVTFLYKLTPGACPKSYGTNVARLAGLPASVVSRAAAVSAQKLLGDGTEDAAASGAQLADAAAKALQQLKALEAAAGGDEESVMAQLAQLQAMAQQALASAGGQ